MNRTVQDELADAITAQAEEKLGRARTCARRAAGVGLRQRFGLGPGKDAYAPDTITGLRRLSTDPAIPSPVRDAAARLVARSAKDRTSESIDPVQDAKIILRYLDADSSL